MLQRQSPRPDVITASLGFGFDQYGLPGRYLEDDPLTEAIVQAIVHSGVAVCISANDGIRSGNTTATHTVHLGECRHQHSTVWQRDHKFGRC